jgi:hypothetical protein
LKSFTLTWESQPTCGCALGAGGTRPSAKRRKVI